MLTNSNIKFKSVFNRRKRTKKSRPYKQTNISSKKIKLNHKKKTRTKRKRTTKRNKKKNIIGGTHEEERKLINNILDRKTDYNRLINFYNRETDTHNKNFMMMLKDEKEEKLNDAYSKYAKYIEKIYFLDSETALILAKDNIDREVIRLNLISELDSSNLENLKAIHDSALKAGFPPSSDLVKLASKQLAAMSRRGPEQYKYPRLNSSIQSPYNSDRPVYK